VLDHLELLRIKKQRLVGLAEACAAAATTFMHMILRARKRPFMKPEKSCNGSNSNESQNVSPARFLVRP